MRWNSRTFAVVIASLFIACLVPVGLWACASPQEVRANKAIAETRKADLDSAVAAATPKIASLAARKASLTAERDNLEAELDTIAAADPTRSDKASRLAYVKARLLEIESPLEEATKARDAAKADSSTLGSRITEADDALNASASEPNSGTAIGQVLGTIIPGAAVLAPFLGGLAYRTARLMRANSALTGDLNQKANSLDRIVASIDVLAGIAPEVATAIKANKATLDAVQGPAAKLAVDAAQAKVTTIVPAMPAQA
jgi:hypothetical protein